jgi:hypothetical protein
MAARSNSVVRTNLCMVSASTSDNIDSQEKGNKPEKEKKDWGKKKEREERVVHKENHKVT